MPCPFLARLNSSFIRNYGPTLLKSYGSQCPVISKALNTVAENPEAAAVSEQNNSNQEVKNCPFLKEVPNIIKEVKQDDTIETSFVPEKLSPTPEVTNKAPSLPSQSFPYNDFFHQQILKKKKEHSYRIFKKVNRLAGEFPYALEYTSGEKRVLVWCSNDYLGISGHPEVKEAVRNALDRFGSGAGGTRNIAANSTLHEKLESTIANLHQKEAALLFTSCFVANDSTLFTLAKALPGCHIFSDAGNHASMIQGIRNSQVPKHIFRHNDCAHLEELLQTVDIKTPKIVAFETVHSMTGAVCPLEKMCDTAHKYGALTFVDEVHAVGLYGEHGAGIGERDNVMHKMDMISGTLGKAFGNIGGYVAANAQLIDMIRSYAAGFIFTTSLPPTVLAGARKAIEILSSEEGRVLRKKHQANVHYLRESLLSHKFPVEHTPSHIIPIKIGNPLHAAAVCDVLLKEKGHYIQAINYPTVPKGEEKLRLAPTPYHTKDMMDTLVADMKDVWEDLKLPLTGLQCDKQCMFCQKPILFQEYESREKRFPSQLLSRVVCNIPNCPQIARGI